MPTRDTAALAPDVRALHEKLLARARAIGLDVITTCTWRAKEDQEYLWSSGRTRAGPILTYARAGESLHNYTTWEGTPAARAFDLLIVRGGKIVSDGHDHAYETLAVLAESLGLEAAKHWPHAFEAGHFQLRIPEPAEETLAPSKSM